jgi:hypothetical protein
LDQLILGPAKSPTSAAAPVTASDPAQGLIEEVTRTQGGGGGGITTPLPAAPAPIAPGSAKPKLNHDGGPVSGELGDTGGRRDAPAFDNTQGAPKTYTLKSPQGNTGQRSFTEQGLVDWLAAHKNWSIVE